MQNPSADERRIKDLVEIQIVRESKRQGPKPNAEKIVKILTLISRNTRRHILPLTEKEIAKQIPQIKENVIEKYLQFLLKFPEKRPFLKRERLRKSDKTPGAPPYTYVFDLYYLLDTPKPQTLQASIALAPSEEPPAN